MPSKALCYSVFRGLTDPVLSSSLGNMKRHCKRYTGAPVSKRQRGLPGTCLEKGLRGNREEAGVCLDLIRDIDCLLAASVCGSVGLGSGVLAWSSHNTPYASTASTATRAATS